MIKFELYKYYIASTFRRDKSKWFFTLIALFLSPFFIPLFFFALGTLFSKSSTVPNESELSEMRTKAQFAGMSEQDVNECSALCKENTAWKSFLNKNRKRHGNKEFFSSDLKKQKNMEKFLNAVDLRTDVELNYKELDDWVYASFKDVLTRLGHYNKNRRLANGDLESLRILDRYSLLVDKARQHQALDWQGNLDLLKISKLGEKICLEFFFDLRILIIKIIASKTTIFSDQDKSGLFALTLDGYIRNISDNFNVMPGFLNKFSYFLFPGFLDAFKDFGMFFATVHHVMISVVMTSIVFASYAIYPLINRLFITTNKNNEDAFVLLATPGATRIDIFISKFLAFVSCLSLFSLLGYVFQFVACSLLFSDFSFSATNLLVFVFYTLLFLPFVFASIFGFSVYLMNRFSWAGKLLSITTPIVLQSPAMFVFFLIAFGFDFLKAYRLDEFFFSYERINILIFVAAFIGLIGLFLHWRNFNKKDIE